MTSRERVRAALEGGTPDRVPVALGFHSAPLARLVPDGWPVEGAVDAQFISLSPSPVLEDLRRRALPFKPDTRLGTPEQAAHYARWRYRPQRGKGQNPLAGVRSIRDIRSFRFPRSRTSARAIEAVASAVADLHARGFAVGGSLPHLGGDLFEGAWRLRGLERFLLDVIERPEWARLLLDRLAEFASGHAEALARTGVDVLALGDDVGMPGSMMVGPDAWRGLFKPRMAAIIASARRIRPDIAVLFHSDGWFEPILPDLVEIGVNGINPLQPEHMDAAEIRARFGAGLAFWGTVGSQRSFARAAPGEIREEVRVRIRALGPRGLVLSPAYDIDTPEIRRENVAAFLSAARDFGGDAR